MKILTLLTALIVSFGVHAQQSSLIGFSAERSERQREWENVMATVPDGARMGEYHREMTRRPHHAGTEENYRLALYLRRS
jgi:hypothetical protein